MQFIRNTIKIGYYLILLFFFSSSFYLAFAQNSISIADMNLTATFTCIGIRVSYTGDDNANAAAAVKFRPSGSGDWRSALPLARILKDRFAGSIFYLEPGVEYEVKVTIDDPDGVTGGEQTGTVTTRSEEIPEGGGKTWYVSVDGNDLNTGGPEDPFRTISKAHNHAYAGDIILVRPGIYREEVDITRSGTADGYIVYRAEAGGVILDGADPTYENIDAVDNWKAESGGVYSTYPGYLTSYVGVDDQRLYHYQSLQELKDLSVGPPGGWFQDESSKKLYIKLTSGDDPDDHKVQVARFNYGFRLSMANYVMIDGFEIRYYGADSRGRGVLIDGGHDNVVQNNLIHGVLDGIVIRRSSAERNLIQDNHLYDTSILNWAWSSVKAHQEENSGISSTGGGGNVIRRNKVHGFFNGIAASVWSDLANEVYNHDMDVYENDIYNINDDCLEPEGACINIRFWGNWLHQCHTPVSLAPITVGPCYVIRNVIYDYGYTAIKYNVKAPVETRGPCFIYHNTICTNRSGVNGLEMPLPWTNQFFRNNIIVSTRYVIEDMGPAYEPVDLDYDCLFTSYSPLIKWKNERYYTLEAFTSATGLEKHGISQNPVFVDIKGGNLRLRSYSPCVDAGVRLPNINDDYVGSAPDMGAFEFGSTTVKDSDSGTGLPPACALLQSYPNPANPAAVIPFAINGSGTVRLDIYNVKGQLVRKLVNRRLEPGMYRIAWDGREDNGRDAPSGVYFYRLRFSGAGRRNFSAVKKLVLVR